MRRYIIPVAALLVLVAGSVAWAYSGRQGPGVAGPNGTTGGGATGVLEEVLADLVADGTINQDQSDAIVAAVEERKTEIMDARKGLKTQMMAFWEDGILTADEIEQLPVADWITDPDGPLAEALEDGSITREELEELATTRRGYLGQPGRSGPWHRGAHGGRWHHKPSNIEEVSGTAGTLSL